MAMPDRLMMPTVRPGAQSPGTNRALGSVHLHEAKDDSSPSSLGCQFSIFFCAVLPVFFRVLVQFYFLFFSLANCTSEDTNLGQVRNMHYLHQGGYVLAGVCLIVCLSVFLSVYLLAASHKTSY